MLVVPLATISTTKRHCSYFQNVGLNKMLATDTGTLSIIIAASVELPCEDTHSISWAG